MPVWFALGAHLTCNLTSAMTLPAKNVSLVECLISRKGSGNNEAGTSAVHARIQARSGAAGRGWPEHCGGDPYIGSRRPDTLQLGQGAARRQTQGG
jgi:hypothetical protein